jgi:hypothetical protein
MRKLFVSALFCLAFFGRVESIVLVQSNGVDRNSTSTPELAFVQPNVGGNTITVGVRAGGHTGHDLFVNDTQGNIYRRLGTVDGGPNSTHALFIAQDIAAGPNTITIGDTTSYSGVRIVIREYSDFATFFGNATLTSGSGTSIPLDSSVSSIVTEAQITSVTSTPVTAIVEWVNLRLGMVDGATSVSLSSSTAWTVLSIVITIIPEMPIGYLATQWEWDAVTGEDTDDDGISDSGVPIGYRIYYTAPGCCLSGVCLWPATQMVDIPADVEHCGLTNCTVANACCGDFLAEPPGDLLLFVITAYNAGGESSTEHGNDDHTYVCP